MDFVEQVRTAQDAVPETDRENAAAIAAWLNEPAIDKTDATRWDWARLAARFGPASVSKWDAGLRALGLVWACDTLAGVGLDFSHPYTQSMLDQLGADAAHFPPVDIAALKAIGAWKVSRHAEWGGSGTVTAEQVAAALSAIALDALRVEVARRWNDLATAIDAGDVTTLSAAIAKFGA